MGNIATHGGEVIVLCDPEDSIGDCCCCVTKFCVSGGFGPIKLPTAIELQRDPTQSSHQRLVEQIEDAARRGFRAEASFNFGVDWKMIGTGNYVDAYCGFEYHETVEPRNKDLLARIKRNSFPGYGAFGGWKFDNFNEFSDIGFNAFTIPDWRGLQVCSKAGDANASGQWHWLDMPGYVPQLKDLFKDMRLLSFARTTSKCKGCDNCCALVYVDYAADTVRVAGPVCGAVCDALPRVRTVLYEGQNVVDAQATFDNWQPGSAWRMRVPQTVLNAALAGDADSKCAP